MNREDRFGTEALKEVEALGERPTAGQIRATYIQLANREYRDLWRRDRGFVISCMALCLWKFGHKDAHQQAEDECRLALTKQGSWP